MTKNELNKIIAEQVSPIYSPFGCQLQLEDFSETEIKLKLTCPPLDIFKVQGKIVKMEDELKKKIENRLSSAVKTAKVIFV